MPLRLPSPGGTFFGDWTPDGRYFFFSYSHDGHTELWYVKDGRFNLRSTTPFPLITGALGAFDTVASPLEKRLFFIGAKSSSKFLEFDPRTKITRAFLPDFNGNTASYSADGQWVVANNSQGTLWRVRSDGTDWLQLTYPKLFRTLFT